MSDKSFLERLPTWVEEHAAWGPAGAAGITFLEGLLFIGFFVPAATTLFAIGTLVGTGTLGLVGVTIGAVLGALAGTSLSYWIGRRYSRQIYTFGPLARHPQILDSGRRFLERHGAAALIIGRFLKPLRVTLPAVAGTVGMPPGRFLLLNTIAILLWVSWYLLLGMGLGRTLRTVVAADPRSVILSLALLAALSLAAWLMWRRYIRRHEDAA